MGHIQKYQHAKTGRYCNWRTIFNRLFIYWMGHIQKYQHKKTGRYCNWWTKYKVIGSLFSSCFYKYWLLYRESLYKFSLGVGTWEGMGYRHLFILVFNLHSFILYGLLYCLSSYYIPSFDVPCSSSLFCFVIMSVKNCWLFSFTIEQHYFLRKINSVVLFLFVFDAISSFFRGYILLCCTQHFFFASLVWTQVCYKIFFSIIFDVIFFFLGGHSFVLHPTLFLCFLRFITDAFVSHLGISHNNSKMLLFDAYGTSSPLNVFNWCLGHKFAPEWMFLIDV